MPSGNIECSDDAPVFREQDVVGAAGGGGTHDFEAYAARHDRGCQPVVDEAMTGTGTEDDHLRLELEGRAEVGFREALQSRRRPVGDDPLGADDHGLPVLFAVDEYGVAGERLDIIPRAPVCSQFHANLSDAGSRLSDAGPR